MRHLLSLIVLFAYGSGAIAAPHTPDRALRRIQGLSINGRMIPPGSDCERLLVDAEVKFGKPLPATVIHEMIGAILKATGESLIEKVYPSPPYSPPSLDIYRNYSPGFFCFTGKTRIAVPGGRLVEIAHLKAGDAVLSFDFTTGRAVGNRIEKTIVTPDQSYGRLRSGGQHIEVTERERFYARPQTGERWNWLPIGELAARDHLAFAKPVENQSCRLIPTVRGEFINHVGQATVYNLEMVGEPRNFFVEGFLVHNPHK